MQNFLPYANFVRSAQVLDRARLGKQRIESQTVMRALTGEIAWGTNQPIVLMWQGYEGTLMRYILAMCDEWERRGYRDETRGRVQEMYGRWLKTLRFDEPTNFRLRTPPWLGYEPYHAGHRTSLMRKMPEHYEPLLRDDTPVDIDPFWPVTKRISMDAWHLYRGRATLTP